MIFHGKTVWLSWHNHPRSRSIANLLGLRLIHFSRIESGALRHVLGFIWTLFVLGFVRPQTIFLQNSFLLLLGCVFFKKMCIGIGRKTVIINDCHNKSLKRQVNGPGSSLFRKVKQWCFNQVDCVIVSNRLMLPHAQALTSCVAILRDPLSPETVLDEFGDGEKSPTGHILFVCSFENDEPVEAIQLSIAELSELWRIPCIVTGRFAAQKLGTELSASPFVQCPGFLPYKQYLCLLKRAAVVVVLTTDDDCLVCGGYEALAAERPLVLSDTKVLQQVFGKSAIYTSNQGTAVTCAVRKAMTMPSSRIVQAKNRFNTEFSLELTEFFKVLVLAQIIEPVSEQTNHIPSHNHF